MAKFGAATAGHILSDYCPESCKVCDQEKVDGEARYCADNTAWTDSMGHTCVQYKTTPSLKKQCFTNSAYVACPVACDACGDCCASYGDTDDLCFFLSKYGDGSEVTGVKYNDLVTLSGDSPVTPGAAWSVKTDFGLITYEKGNFEPDPLIDGVWGLGKVSDENNCNPSCGSMQPLDAFVATTGAHGLTDLFAICLDFNGISTLDIGVISPSKHAQTINFFDIISDTEYQIANPTKMAICLDPTTCTPFGTSFAGYQTIVDLGSEGIELPQDLFEEFQTAYQSVIQTFAGGLLVADMITKNCAGPLPDESMKLDDLALPSIEMQITDNRGNPVTLTLSPRDYLDITIDSVCLNVMGRPMGTNNYLILGRPMIQAYYTIFDRANNQVGFGESSGICKVGKQTCEADEFQCMNGECIPADSVSDGNPDCTDASDEQGAGPPSGQPNYNPNTGGSSGTAMECPGLNSPDHGSVLSPGAVASYTCDPGFEISGLVTRNCLAGGQWTGVPPTCIPRAAGSDGTGSSANCIEIPNSAGRTCGTYLQYGYSCEEMLTIYKEIDCHCSCATTGTNCDSQAVVTGCSNPSVALDPNHFCDNSCATAIIGQWDNCANDATVAPLMKQYSSVRQYCISQGGGGGH
jgi:hypothetical protein